MMHGALRASGILPSRISEKSSGCRIVFRHAKPRLFFGARKKIKEESRYKMTIQYKVSYSFVSLPNTAIADYADTIIKALTGNAGFPNPPVALTLVETQKQDFLVKLAATAQGGTLATSAKNDAWDVLTGSLRQLAAYVQSLAGNDL